MERLEVIKTAKGPMLRSELVAEVWAALLAAGFFRGYTFSSAAEVPSSSNAPGSSESSGDSFRRPERPQGTILKNRVVNRSQGHLTACVLNLGHWERSRKRSTPLCFHHLIDWDGTLEERKRDPTCTCGTSSLISSPISVPISLSCKRPAPFASRKEMEEHGLLTATSPDKTLLCGIRANPWPGAYTHHIAGARTVRRYKETPLQYAIFEACFGDELEGRTGREQACPTTRKLNVNFFVRRTLPKIRLSGLECMSSAFAPSTQQSSSH